MLIFYHTHLHLHLSNVIQELRYPREALQFFAYPWGHSNTLAVPFESHLINRGNFGNYNGHE